jgi:hypothetical protein
MTFKQFFSFNEEYTYYLDRSIDSIVKIFNDDLERSKKNIEFRIKRLKSGDMFGENAFSADATKKVIQCLKVFHEAEYKYNVLKQNNIQCNECINVIDKTFKYINAKFYYTTQYWLLAHNCINDFFDFKTLNIQNWDEIEGWAPSEEEIKQYKTPNNWPGNNPNEFEIYTNQIKPITLRLNAAHTIAEKIIAATIALNSIHTNGQMLEYGGFKQEDLTLLSNLDSKLWNKELNKEFDIRL